MTAVVWPARTVRPAGVLWIMLASAFLGCAAPSTVGEGASPSGSSRSVSPIAGLRGVAVVRVDCSAFDLQPPGVPVALPSPPVSLVLCPVRSLAQPPPTRLAPAPPALLAALASSDIVAGPGSTVPCPMYADRAELVYAILADGSVYRLRIPQDVCRHYQRQVLGIIAEHRPGAPTG